MGNKGFLALLLIVMITHGTNGSMFGWIWNSRSDETTVLVADGVPLVSIPYESMTEDEKFLQEAAKFTDIQVSSPLETCQHKVIMKIRTACSDMSEEDLAKLSVNLLNCQSAVEGRKMFPCTEEMSLKQCTTDMDADMWNAYHLMSNRARAVCYAARSTQFRALSELTVNKLMQAAHSQIQTLGSLKDSQDRLEEKTTETLSSLADGNKALLQQQQHLRDAQTSAHNLVTMNLRELTNERALIRTGHTQLTAMAEDIKNRLEEASQNIVQQAMERGENHREVLEDLMNIQEQAQLIWDKIESSTNRIFQQHEDALDRYEHTVHKLAEINDTIQFIWNVTTTMRAEMDEKLNWITSYIGDTGEQMYNMYRAALHIVYIMVAMIVAAFLNAPFLTRATIMGIVPMNLVSFLKHGPDACLDFVSITTLIILITAMHYVMIGIQYIFGPKSRRSTTPVPANFVHRNGHTNGVGHFTSSPIPSRPPPAISMYTKLTGSIAQFNTAIRNRIRRCKQICGSLILSAISWARHSLPQCEELSCSYLPSKKSRENLVFNYERDYPSMSEDITDFETTGIVQDEYPTDAFDEILDAGDLRLRLRKLNGSTSRSSSQQRTVSRSTTPSRTAPRMLCCALTRTGRNCRMYAAQGQNVCSKHAHGSSILGD